MRTQQIPQLCMEAHTDTHHNDTHHTNTHSRLRQLNARPKETLCKQGGHSLNLEKQPRFPFANFSYFFQNVLNLGFILNITHHCVFTFWQDILKAKFTKWRAPVQTAHTSSCWKGTHLVSRGDSESRGQGEEWWLWEEIPAMAQRPLWCQHTLLNTHHL